MPSTLSEIEIFSRLEESLREAAEVCQKLAWDPKRGFLYDRFRRNLKLIEGCCRQIFYYREDAHWLVLKQLCEFAHKNAGDWLRNSPTAVMRNKMHPRFKKLGEALTHMHEDVKRLRHMATFRLGPILPDLQPGPHREARPVAVMLPDGFRRRQSGLIVNV